MGVCGVGATPMVARAALHFWEEPPISGEAGSGAIFFSGCSLRCVFCQNHQISQGAFGVEVTSARIAQMMLELEAQGALNINLVTPTHYAPHVVAAVAEARELGMGLPIVGNTSGYELVDAVEALAGVVDVWLTDFKYADPALAGRLSGAPDYPQMAADALAAMVRGVQSAGIAATIKHFACNNKEQNRRNCDSRVSARAPELEMSPGAVEDFSDET